jgi:hypothetical protein
LKGQTLDRLLTVLRVVVRSRLVNPGQSLDRNEKGQPMNDSRTPAARGLFLAAALLSFGLSVALYFSGEHTDGIFVGLWVPSILALGAFLAPRRASGETDRAAAETAR